MQFDTIFLFMLRIEFFNTSREISLMHILQNHIDDKSTLVQVMIWYHKAMLIQINAAVWRHWVKLKSREILNAHDSNFISPFALKFCTVQGCDTELLWAKKR